MTKKSENPGEPNMGSQVQDQQSPEIIQDHSKYILAIEGYWASLHHDSVYDIADNDDSVDELLDILSHEVVSREAIEDNLRYSWRYCPNTPYEAMELIKERLIGKFDTYISMSIDSEKNDTLSVDIYRDGGMVDSFSVPLGE